MPTHTVLVQAAPNKFKEDTTTYIGYTTTKKIGKAHVRNRARRRMRAAARELFPSHAMEGYSYVLIGRFDTADCPFEHLRQDIIYALKKITKLFTQPEENSPDTSSLSSADSQH